MRGRQSAPRPFGVKCKKLLPESQVLEDEIFAGTDGGDNPADEVSEQCNHGENRNRTAAESLVAKSLIL